jgi:hypothetical protein
MIGRVLKRGGRAVGRAAGTTTAKRGRNGHVDWWICYSWGLSWFWRSYEFSF